MHISGHKNPKTFTDNNKPSSEELPDETATMSKKDNDMW